MKRKFQMDQNKQIVVSTHTRSNNQEVKIASSRKKRYRNAAEISPLCTAGKMLGNRLPEGGFEDERSVRRFLYSPLDLCMLEEQGGLKKGLKIALCGGLVLCCEILPGWPRHPKRNPAPMLLTPPPRESRTFKGSADK